MKQPFLLAALLLLTCSSALAQTAEQRFQQANMYYQQGRLNDARTLYQSILAEGYVSGQLYYNLANAYYRSGDIAHAIVNYERARRLIPQDEDLRHNMLLAGMMITDRIEATPRLFVWDAWEGMKEGLSLSGVTWLAYLAYVIIAGFVLLLILGRTYTLKKVGLIGAATSGVVFLFFLVVFLSKLSDVSATDEAIVMVPIVTVKNSPDEKGTDAFVLHSGVKVRITDRVSEWIKIRLADGKVGWLDRGSIEVI